MKASLAPLVLLTALLANGTGRSQPLDAAPPPFDDRWRVEFRTPPPVARPWTYWFVMDGNWSRDGITADLEAMSRAGLGGLILMEVDMGLPRGPVRFMSPEWQELFRHAVREAQRLGLQITLNAGPGWTGSGGPWVRPEQSMQHLVCSQTNVIGPSRFDGVLPRPLPRPPFFGEGGLSPEQTQARRDFYEDVAVLAFPSPATNARIGDIDEKAFYLRAPYSSQPGVKAFLPLPARQPAARVEHGIRIDQIVDLTGQLAAGGRLLWEIPEGRWTLLRFGRTSTGQNTRPAPQPGLGLECDKLDRTALDAHFFAFVEPLLRGLDQAKVNEAGWTMLHIDSWEMSAQNWTPRLRAEFEARRGYDLWRYLPTLHGLVVEDTERSERFLWDLRQTIQELIVQNHALHLKELGRERGLGLSIEPYDMNPCADLTLGGVADVPMGEFWAKGFGFNADFSCFEAVSIAHTLGKPIIGAESFTSDGEGWLLHPGAMKPQGDWALAAGINRFVFHRYQHQPWLDRSPGLTMGSIGSHWERTQTWWEFVPAYHQYLARCQLLLRSGRPVADICYLVPEGAPNVFRPPPSATRGDPPDRLGHNFDGCAPETVRDRMRARDGRVWLPGGMSYALLVLPRVEAMTPPLLSRIQQLVEEGAIVQGSPPTHSPSLNGYPQCDETVRRLATELWTEEIPGSERRVGSGRLFTPSRPGPSRGGPEELYPPYAESAAVLRRLGVTPDFESDGPLRFSHRHLSDGDIYFVANTSGQRLNTAPWFRVRGQAPELWDPLTGEQRLLSDFSEENGRTRIPLRFEPFQSYFVVFRAAPQPRTSREPNFIEPSNLGEIGGAWAVQFQSGRGAPGGVQMASLQDWAEHADAGVRYFSGVATYQTSFDWPLAGRPLPEGARVAIDLGEVQVMAAVRLNGQDLGITWTLPFRVDATGAVRPGANTLEVRVANLWCNRLIGDAALPPEQRIAWTTWNPFKTNSPLVRSGLMGPVRLLATPKPN